MTVCNVARVLQRATSRRPRCSLSSPNMLSMRQRALNNQPPQGYASDALALSRNIRRRLCIPKCTLDERHQLSQLNQDFLPESCPLALSGPPLCGPVFIR